MSPPRHRPRVLCLDDEPQILDSLQDVLRRRFEVIVTTNGFEALRMIVDKPCAAVISDMRMPRLDGARFLTLARSHAPDTVRLLLTGQATLEDAVNAVNEGEIFRLLLKPCPPEELIAALDAAVARNEEILAERKAGGARATDHGTLDGIVSGLEAVIDAADSKATTRGARVQQLARDLAEAAADVAPSWSLDTAARLSQLGIIGLDPRTLDQLSSRRPLDAEQAAEVEAIAGRGERIVRPIPGLEAVRSLLAHQATPFEPTRPGTAGTPIPARVLRIALDYDLLDVQRVPPAAAVRRMRRRTGRYDPALLDAFAEMLRVE